MTRDEYNKAMDRLRRMSDRVDDSPEDVDGMEMYELLASVDEYISHLDSALDTERACLAIAEERVERFNHGAYLATAVDDPWIRDKVRRGIDRAATDDPMGAWDAGMRELIGTEVEVIL